MKEPFRIIGLVIGILVLALAGFAAFTSVRGITHHPVPQGVTELPSTPARVVQGEEIASVMCAHCHRNPATNTLTGRPMPDLGSDPGKLNSANLTQDPTYGNVGEDRRAGGNLAPH